MIKIAKFIACFLFITKTHSSIDFDRLLKCQIISITAPRSPSNQQNLYLGPSGNLQLGVYPDDLNDDHLKDEIIRRFGSDSNSFFYYLESMSRLNSQNFYYGPLSCFDCLQASKYMFEQIGIPLGLVDQQFFDKIALKIYQSYKPNKWSTDDRNLELLEYYNTIEREMP